MLSTEYPALQYEIPSRNTNVYTIIIFFMFIGINELHAWHIPYWWCLPRLPWTCPLFLPRVEWLLGCWVGAVMWKYRGLSFSAFCTSKPLARTGFLRGTPSVVVAGHRWFPRDDLVGIALFFGDLRFCKTFECSAMQSNSPVYFNLAAWQVISSCFPLWSIFPLSEFAAFNSERIFFLVCLLMLVLIFLMSSSLSWYSAISAVILNTCGGMSANSRLQFRWHVCFWWSE